MWIVESLIETWLMMQAFTAHANKTRVTRMLARGIIQNIVVVNPFK